MEAVLPAPGERHAKKTAMVVDDTVVRRLSETARHAIEPFQGSEALTAGKVNLIGLDAIVEALGGRWQPRREQIYDHVERVLSRNLGPNGYFVRVAAGKEFYVYVLESVDPQKATVAGFQ